MDTKLKKNIVLQNNYICKFGYLQNKTNYISCKNYFNYDYCVGTPISFCDVYVVKLHSLVIAKEFINCNLSPVIVNLVGEKYTEHNIENLEGVYDEILNLRTNFQCISRQNNNFPPKDNEVIYTPQVMVLRDELLNPICNISNIFKVAFITITSRPEIYKILPYRESENIESDSSSDSKIAIEKIKTIMTVETYMIFKHKIELIFQTAHYAGNNVIIFNDFGIIKDKLPTEDIIDIFNICILKYGHLFKEVVFAFNVRLPKEHIIYEQFCDKIIKPQDIIIEDTQNDELLANIIIASKNL